MRAPRLLAAAIVGLFASSAGATGLLEVWQAAARNDRDYAVARAADAAAAPRRDQAAALWRPTVGVSLGAGFGTSQTAVEGARFSAPGFGESTGVSFGTSVTGGTMTRWAISAAQPLYNPERSAQQKQITLSVEMSGAEFDAARQGLMLATAQRYFELALAEESVRVLKLRLEAVERAHAEARDRYELGALPVTGVHEAKASLADVQAQLSAAQAELQVRRNQLADSTGIAEAALAADLPANTPDIADLPPLTRWFSDAEQGNAELRIRRMAVDAARQEASKFTAGAAPTVDLVAQASRERIAGSGDFGPSASNTATHHIVGLRATIPLYTGGYRSAKSAEARLLVEKAEAEAERTRQQVAQQIRASWLALQAGAERARALSDGLTAARARRDATQTGVQVGHRTTQNLLDAESDLASMQLALSRARVDVLLGRLRLAQLAGQLDESRLRKIAQP